MHLIKIADDVFVAADVSAVLVRDLTVTIVLRRPETQYDYDFETEKDAHAAARACIKALLEI